MNFEPCVGTFGVAYGSVEVDAYEHRRDCKAEYGIRKFMIGGLGEHPQPDVVICFQGLLATFRFDS